MSAQVLAQEELEEKAPAADEIAAKVVEAMDVQVASGLSAVDAPVENTCGPWKKGGGLGA